MEYGHPWFALPGLLFTAAVWRLLVETEWRLAPTQGCALPGFPGFFPASLGVDAFRPRQAEIVAQCLSFILGAEQTTALQLGHHKLAKIIVRPGNVRRHDRKAVACSLGEPVFHVVGDLFRCADEHVLAPRPRDPVAELSDREIFAPRHRDDAVVMTTAAV